MTTAKKSTKKIAAKKVAPRKSLVRTPSRVDQFEYEALSYSQRKSALAPRFVLFHATAHDIALWADVDRLSVENTTGAQRPLRPLKVGKVVKYLKDEKNTIPTAVVVALDESTAHFTAKHGASSCGTLEIRHQHGTQKPGLIIDGQHRVFGVAQHSPATQLNVVAFLGGDDAERAFQFVVINNSAAKVSKDHIKALNLKFDQEKLNQRLIASAGVAMGVSEEKYEDLSILDGSEPFKGLIDWATNRAGFVAANALESALGETRDRAHLLGIEGLEIDVFLQIWLKVREIRSRLWKPFPASRLLMKVSIHTITVYVLESMVARLRTADAPIDFTDVKTLDDLVERVISRIPVEFWTTEWKAKELDTTAGRKIVLDALGVIDSNVRYGRVWYDGVAMIDSALLHGQTYGGTKSKAKTKAKASKA